MGSKDQVGRLFAQLTAQLEDACDLAVQGQSHKSSFSVRRTLLRRLRRDLNRSLTIVGEIDGNLLQERGGGQ